MQERSNIQTQGRADAIQCLNGWPRFGTDPDVSRFYQDAGGGSHHIEQLPVPVRNRQPEPHRSLAHALDVVPKFAFQFFQNSGKIVEIAASFDHLQRRDWDSINSDRDRFDRGYVGSFEM
jgi:hypothetical protein